MISELCAAHLYIDHIFKIHRYYITVNLYNSPPLDQERRRSPVLVLSVLTGIWGAGGSPPPSSGPLPLQGSPRKSPFVSGGFPPFPDHLLPYWFFKWHFPGSPANPPLEVTAPSGPVFWNRCIRGLWMWPPSPRLSGLQAPDLGVWRIAWGLHNWKEPEDCGR